MNEQLKILIHKKFVKNFGNFLPDPNSFWSA